MEMIRRLDRFSRNLINVNVHYADEYKHNVHYGARLKITATERPGIAKGDANRDKLRPRSNNEQTFRMGAGWCSLINSLFNEVNIYAEKC